MAHPNQQDGRETRIRWAEAANAFLVSKSHTKEMSDAISAFMKKYGVGQSEFGRLMDLAGTHVSNHRLYGHHLIFDFPPDLAHMPDFLLHDFSDLFTNYGLPILPGRVVEGTPLFNYCNSIGANKPWNMVNGFDVFAGTLAIYQGLMTLDRALRQQLVVEDLEQAAKSFGIGILEFALALSSHNPFLLVGCLLQICAGLRGILNEGATVRLRKATRHLTLDVWLPSYTAEQITKMLTAYAMNRSLTIEAHTRRLLL